MARSDSVLYSALDLNMMGVTCPTWVSGVSRWGRKEAGWCGQRRDVGIQDQVKVNEENMVKV